MRKLLAASLGLLVLLAALSPLLLKRLLPPERVRALVVEGARKSLRREVRLGDVSLGILSGLTLRDLSISEAPTFEAGTFASMSAFSVRVKLAPLLRKKVVVDSVAASGLSVRVLKKKDGRYNFSDLLSGGPARGEGQASGGGGAAQGGADVEVAVSRFGLDGAAVEYAEEGADRALKLSQVSARVAGFSLSGAFDAELAGKAAGRWDGRALDGEASFSGSVDLGGRDPRKLSATAKKLSVSAGGWRLEAAGTAADLAQPRLDVELEAHGPSGRVAQGAFRGTVTPPEGKKPLSAEGSLELRTSALEPKDAAALGLPAGAPLPALTVSADFGYAGDAVGFKRLEVKTPFGPVKASGRAGALAGGKPDLDLAFDADLDLPAAKAADLPWAKLPPGFVSPAVKIKGEGRFKGDDLTLSALRLKGSAGTLDVSGSVRGVRSQAPQPALELAVDLSLPALKSADDPFGKVPPGLELPPSKWDGALSLSRDEVKLSRGLKIVVGRNEVEVESGGRAVGLRSGAPLVHLMLKCRQFHLEELTAVSQATKELGLRGSGFFVLGATGKLPRPVLEGKAQFKDVGAHMGGVELQGFTGTASFNETRIDVPNLRGKVGDGELDLNLTIKNYAKAPDVELESSLTRFDLGKWQAARAAMAAKKGGGASATPAAASEPAKDAAPASVPPIAARGKFTVGELVHSNAHARDLRLTWDLEGITPDLRRLGGTAKLSSSGGDFKDLAALGTQSKAIKVLIFPVMVLQKIGRIGGIRLFPDFNNVVYTELTGDYDFAGGVMTLRDSRIRASAGDGSAVGKIDLPNEQLDLTVTAKIGGVGTPIDVAVTGTFDKPESKVKVGKAVVDSARQLLEKPAQKLLDQLLKR